MRQIVLVTGCRSGFGLHIARDAAQAVPAAESKATEANPDPTVQAPREPEPVRAAPPRHRSRLFAWLAALWR